MSILSVMICILYCFVPQKCPVQVDYLILHWFLFLISFNVSLEILCLLHEAQNQISIKYKKNTAFLIGPLLCLHVSINVPNFIKSKGETIQL